jgi:methionyl aminopeptidase
MRLQPGMTLAIEPMIVEGSYETRELEDGWTVVTIDGKLSAHFEHTIAIMPEGKPDIMTLRPE